jgi:hypothetical protein
MADGRLGSVFGLIAVAVVVVTALAGGDRGHHTAAETPSAAGGVVTAAPAAERHARTPATGPAQRTAAWYRDGGKSLITAITADLADPGTSAATAPADCPALERDVAGALRHPAIPDRDAQRLWSAALRDLRAGAAACGHPAAAGREIRAGGARLSRAADLVRAAAGR